MDQFVIQGGNRLEGTIKINGAKNAVLPILVASLLTQEMVILNNVPYLKDILVMNKLLQKCGAKIILEDNIIQIKSNILKKIELPETTVSKISTSILLVGALLKQYPKVTIPVPGGCNIGTRELDIHIKGLVALGANICIKDGFIIAEADKRLKGTNITFKFPSVGATHHIIIAACLADGETIINNAAKEPEVVDLANFLNSMGADIKGAGTDIIRIVGVEMLNGTTYSIMSDRITTGTYMIAAAVTGGSIQLNNTKMNILQSVAEKLREIGVKVTENNEGIRVISSGEIRPVEIITEVYPGFPTDMQPVITPLLAIADGESRIQENIFNNRFTHMYELKKMGANIKVDKGIAIVNGVNRLIGSQVTALDLRTGAALILAGLNARGKTIINNAYQIERGYESIGNTLNSLGADVKRFF
ncbi:UDP-N-acetylglucosamine 1-carboxyvinyltransferase [Methanosarcina sp. Ant1]|nr:UDP-N-acetylglucosamine 1-carboxyvinyltransferase [Methanosarcina sp. Ant1]